MEAAGVNEVADMRGMKDMTGAKGTKNDGK